MNAAPQGQSLLDDALGRHVAGLRPGGVMDELAGTTQAIELLVAAARTGILADLRAATALELRRPRHDPGPGGDEWLFSEGYYLALTAERLGRLLDAVQACAELRRNGLHQPAWHVLSGAAATLERMWMLTEAPVHEQPWDEARRSTEAWQTLARVAARADSGLRVDLHPFDIGHDGAESQSEHDALTEASEAAVAADPTAVAVVCAIHQGARLAAVHVPGHLQTCADGAAAPPAGATGLDTEQMVHAQGVLAAALVHAAAVTVRAALAVSVDNRTEEPEEHLH